MSFLEWLRPVRRVVALLPVSGQGLDGRVAEMLKLVSEETEWWKTMNDLLSIQIRHESAAAMLPGISSEDRHYNAGRAAALEDFQRMLHEKWMEARQG